VQQLTHDDLTVKGDVGEVLDQDYSSAYNAVFRGGLHIYTTFDPFSQNRAQAAVRQELAKLPLAAQAQVTAAMVAIHNSNGAVVAMVGGQNFQQSQFNLATQGKRQTGSTFKGITLATALEAGYSPNDRVNGSSLFFPIPGSQPWNVSGDCHGGAPTLFTAI